MLKPYSFAVLVAFAVLGPVVAQDAAATSTEQKLHPYLRDLVRTAEPTTRIPVYFVMADRLGYDHWFPRVFGMKLEQRRATVVAELQQHAERTQHDLVEYLAAAEAAGDVANVRSNWLGNFVLAEATPLTILNAATDDSVAEVWFDYMPPLAAVEDSDPSDPGAAAAAAFIGPLPATAAVTCAPPRTPGPGPNAVSADDVWALGIEGAGVIVMNSDSGIDTSPSYHSDLISHIWTNPGEIPGNNVDDDNNGFVDDVNGWNFGSNTNNLNDSGGHGSSTAGCIAADGTCTGITHGMAPLATIMTGALGGESSQWQAIQYGIQMGAHLQTSSHSYKLYFNPPPNYKMHRDVGVTSLAAGLIRTNSTSNDGSLCGSSSSAGRKPFNISAPGNLPPPYLDPNQTLQGQLGGVIGVAAWNFNSNALMSYSPCGPFAWSLADVLVNRPTYTTTNPWDPAYNDYPWTGGSQMGLIKPDISSPTGTTTTTSAPCSFSTFSGTSNATPCANGVIALWKSANMSLTPEDVGMIVHQTADDRGTVAGKENNWGAGVINADRGVRRALCVHRVDGQPAWTVDHSVAAGAVAFDLDGVPNSAALMILGFARSTVTIGPVTVGVGAAPISLRFGLTDSQGDMSASLPVNGAMVGLSIFSQSLLLDSTYTNEILSSNVIGLGFTP
ncbi:MAG: S8 family serine peptidase [Planctomycetes bacterium]|nr:S8 family serine peptidase [Planctomycetota bacterium]